VSRTASSSRNRVLTEAKNLGIKVANGRYTFVHRGPVNWAGFPFDKHQYAMAVMCDGTGLYRKRGTNLPGSLTMDFALEMFTKLPENSTEVSDEVTDWLFADATFILDNLRNTRYRDEHGDEWPLIYNYEENSDRATEVHDVSLQVQGLIVNIRLHY
jgi:hypothetical protein